MKIIRFWWVIVVLAAVMICSLLAIRLADTTDYHNQDFFTFWLAGHMITQGGNPYAPDQWVAGHHEFNVTWIPNQAYVYPLPLSLLFAPMGWLSLKDAYIVWVTLSGMMILGALILLCLIQPNPRAGMLFVPLLVGTIFFRPTTLTLVNGQLSGFLLILLTATIYLWEKEEWAWGSLFLPFLMLKPNIGAPLLILIILWLLIQKRIRPLLVIFSGLLALLVIGMIQNPHWVQDYWGIGNLKVAQNFGGAPTVWGLSALACHNRLPCMYPSGGIFSILFVLIFLWMIWRMKSLRPAAVLALAACVTLLVTPYTWTYDQLLLIIPIGLVCLAMSRQIRSILPAGLVFPVLDVLAIILLVFNDELEVEILNAFIPLVVFGLCAWVLTRPPNRRVEPRTS